MDFADMWPVYTKCDGLPFLRQKKKTKIKQAQEEYK